MPNLSRWPIYKRSLFGDAKHAMRRLHYMRSSCSSAVHYNAGLYLGCRRGKIHAFVFCRLYFTAMVGVRAMQRM